MAKQAHVVVVGAGLGGIRTIERLRAEGHTGPITLVGAEAHPPYDRPPLSKQILKGQWEPERVVLRDDSALAELDVTARLGARAVGLRGTTVELADGESVTGDAVVVATGVVARTLPEQPSGVFTLRTLDDALALRDALETARSLLIVGAGFIGAEVACAAAERGIEVTVLEAGTVPCERALGPRGGGLAARLFTEGGVKLLCGSAFARFVDARTVELADGATLTADVILVSVGAVPDLAWLDGTGLTTRDGLACDASGRVVGTENVWAVGDAAAWWDGDAAGHHRAEHWTTTIDQAAAVACGIAGTEAPTAGPAYVWSDQFGMKVQTVGRTGAADEVVTLHGEGLEGGPVKGTVLGYFTGGVLRGVASFGAPGLFVRYRAHVASGADRAAVLAQAGR
ncbi:NAD/ferredoxin-dependent reductase-like protein [Actinocorallia herbida]|uniref:NAD/ferredoxin-dependent reductase-like protein n=1 Tax=Actinocorallia herbida TaxID=58109 RepID=A0A3N1D0I8_9ACTN|nr:FAD-dependent oxidoreductase [Actinocorallia herbida]ROO86558.1 NAD/ferredoxin-dependent reductase-like protein [Actinocorallia herbida]